MEYRRYWGEMMCVDGVALFRGRVVIPSTLRQDVLVGLHMAHQGTTGMSLRARDLVW